MVCFPRMSTREALIQEILKQPEPVLRELQHYLVFLAGHLGNEANGVPTPGSKVWPAGYFQKTAGAFAGEQFERPPQLPFEKRQQW